MSGGRRRFAGLLEAGTRAGFAVLLAAGSAALGLAIAWPLWRFATAARQAYTISVLALAAAGIVYVVVRGVLRGRSAARDPGRPRRSALSAVVTTLMVLVGLAGLYRAAALFARGTWILGAAAGAAWVLLLWLLGRARSALRGRKARPVPAENKSR